MSKKRILVIDDKEINIDIMVEILSDYRKDIDLSVSLDPNDVIEMLKDINVNLIITDLEMPKTSGIELAEQIKNFCPNTPIIIWTANENFQVENYKHLFVAQLEKPFKQPQDIFNLVDRYIV